MADPIIEAEVLAKRFGKVQALAGFDLMARGGQVTAVLGPNVRERPRSSARSPG